jgi:hypothetical protein
MSITIKILSSFWIMPSAMTNMIGKVLLYLQENMLVIYPGILILFNRHCMKPRL